MNLDKNSPFTPNISILVVDDVEQNLLVMEALLAQPGWTILKASSGAEALELLLNHEVAVALLDVQMPEMDGFALAELMRGTAKTRHIPIIFVTAASQDQQRTFRGYEAGAVDFLYKPVEPHVLGSKVAVFVDLHVQRQQLQQQVGEVQRLLKLNEMMTAVLTHDLRTPLLAIALSAEIVHRRGHDDAVQKAGQRIKSSSSRMARMIDHLLNFSRVRSGMLRVNPAPADLSAVCQLAIAEIVQVKPDLQLDFHAEGELTGNFDADRMMQVFSNLIGNAAQHGLATEPVSVHLDGNHRNQLSVRIRNAGVLPDDVQAELFTPFRGAQIKEAHRTGMGLGLYIVDQFISAHGGSIIGRSSEAEGTVFEFLIPRLTPSQG